MEALDPETPDHAKKVYSVDGVAFKTTVSPSSNCVVVGVRVPPSKGFTDVARVYNIGSFEQETRNNTKK